MTAWLQTFTFVSVVAMMLVGLFGLVIPVYPGLLIIWLGALIYGLVNGFSALGIGLFVGITLLMIFGEIVDNLLMGLGAHHSGVPWLTIGAAMLAGILTTFLHPLGGLLSVPLVLFLLEYRRLQSPGAAWTSLKGLLSGWGLGVIARFGVGILMILLWGIWVWRG